MALVDGLGGEEEGGTVLGGHFDCEGGRDERTQSREPHAFAGEEVFIFFRSAPDCPAPPSSSFSSFALSLDDDDASDARRKRGGTRHLIRARGSVRAALPPPPALSSSAVDHIGASITSAQVHTGD